MTTARVVLFKYLVMNYGGRHLRSISHIRRSSIEEFLRQISIQTLKNDIFCLSAGFVALLDVEQSHMVMRGRIIVLESDGCAQLFGCHGKTMQLEISKTQFRMCVVGFRFQSRCFLELLRRLRIAT